MPLIHPLYPYSRSTISLRVLNLLLSFTALCLFIGALTTFNINMLNYPYSRHIQPDTIDIWPSLVLLWSIMWSVCRILAQRQTVTALSTPLQVTKGLETLRRTGPAIGVLVGDLVTWSMLLSLMTIDMIYATPFYTRYIDNKGTRPCPAYIDDPFEGGFPTLKWYCTNGFLVAADLELAGLVLCAGCVVGHLVCFGIGCAEVHRRRLGRQVGGGGGMSDVELGGLTAALSRSPQSRNSTNESPGGRVYEEEKRWSSPM